MLSAEFVPVYFLSFVLCLAVLPSALFYARTPEGLTFKHENSPTPEKYLIEAMGGGVALLDYNNDGLLDIFLINSGQRIGSGQSAGSFGRNHPRYWNRLYRQNKNGSFTDVTEAAGLASAGEGNYGMGVAAGDYDLSLIHI